MNNALYVTSAQAAEMLGIAVTSLYAYVGRKNIRSQAIKGKRARLYWREDIEALVAKSAHRRNSNDSILVPETRITLITQHGHYYRGHSAVALSETATLEDVAALLWEQDKDVIFPASAPADPPNFSKIRKALSSLGPLDQVPSLLAILETTNPKSYDLSAIGFARTAGELLRWLTALITNGQPCTDPIHEVLMRGFGTSPEFGDLIRRLLVLSADHELTAPTYAVRAIANTGGTPYQAVMAGLVASRGQRIIEARSPPILRFIEEVMSARSAREPVIDRYRLGENIPGFSQNVYHGSDLRAQALRSYLADNFGNDRDVVRLEEVICAARNIVGVDPDISFLIFFLEWKLKAPFAGILIQIVARSVGWIAHAFEQIEGGEMLRPRAAYVGDLPDIVV